MQVGSLSLFIGPMYSMKTTQLIKSIKNYNSSERLIVKHIADDRYGSSNQYIATHDGTNIPSLSYQTLEEFVSDNINHLVDKKIKAVFIDEGQFFGDLYNSVYDLVNLYHKNVYVAGLDGDYKRNQFDLAISMNLIHNFELYDLKKFLKSIVKISKKSFITTESYRNNRELFNLQCWALTCESFFSGNEWRWLFKEYGYNRDYELIYFS